MTEKSDAFNAIKEQLILLEKIIIAHGKCEEDGTENDYHEVVGQNKFIEQGVMDSPGHATHVGDDIDHCWWMSRDLYEALNSFFPFDVAKALRLMESEEENA